MGKKEVAVGLVIVFLLSGYIFYKQSQTRSQPELMVPETLSIEEAIEDKFNVTIPESLGRAEMKDVSGGSSSGIATLDDQKNFQEVTILADLPSLQQGYLYQGWLYKTGDEAISLGKLSEGKGGWILDYRSNGNILDYKRVVVSLESKLDLLLEKNILEGSFD